MSNAMTSSYTSWFDLPKDVLDLILSKMSFISLLNFGAVCPSLRTVLKSFVSSSYYSQVHQVPWLMLPQGLPKDLENNKTVRFFTFEDNKVLKHINTPPEFYDGLCLGTSYSWAIMVNENLDPYLFNPFSLQQISLPRIDTYPSIVSVSRSVENDYIIEYREHHCKFIRCDVFLPDLRANFISKAVVSASPSHSNGKFYVVMIFEWGNSADAHLAFCWSGDSNWMQLSDANESYCDVVCHEDKFLALNNQENIEIWDVRDSYPVKTTNIMFDIPMKFFETMDSLINCYSTRSYLVEASGDLFLVQRFIGDHLDRVGPFGLQQKHATLLFHVYKLDRSRNEWDEVESLGDQVFFVGGNQSKSVSVQGESAFKANSIYFTDDSWDLIDKHNDSFDLGVFDMQDKSIKSYYLFGLLTEPPPFWIDPEPVLYR